MKKLTLLFGVLMSVALMTSTCVASPEKQGKDPCKYSVSSDVQNDINVAVSAYEFTVYSFDQFGDYQFTAVMSEAVRVPKGTIVYLKQNKPVYVSPEVDRKWVWEIQHQYNC